MSAAASILRAAHFAATKHTGQRRKDPAATPYINHPLEVAHHLADVGGVTDEPTLMAGVCSTTPSRTPTPPRTNYARNSARRSLSLVLECTDDKSLPKPERKRLQIVNAPHKSPRAKQIKIADKTCNLRSVLTDPPSFWSRQRQRDYFEWAGQVVAGLAGVNPALDEEVQRVLAQGRAALAEDRAPLSDD